jgi:hypothetical protein
MANIIADGVEKCKEWNLRGAAGIVVAIGIVYLVSAAHAPVSDNIGVVLVPIILLTIYGPAVSGFAGIVEVIYLRRTGRAEDQHFVNIWKSTQPPYLLQALRWGIGLWVFVGLFATLAGESIGWLLPLFPFWALQYLF